MLSSSADIVITSAKVWTVDKSLPTAQAVTVLGDRIVAVGSMLENGGGYSFENR